MPATSCRIRLAERFPGQLARLVERRRVVQHEDLVDAGMVFQGPLQESEGAVVQRPADTAGHAGIENDDMDVLDHGLVAVRLVEVVFAVEHAAIEAGARVVVAERKKERQADAGESGPQMAVAGDVAVVGQVAGDHGEGGLLLHRLDHGEHLAKAGAGIGQKIRIGKRRVGDMEIGEVEEGRHGLVLCVLQALDSGDVRRFRVRWNGNAAMPFHADMQDRALEGIAVSWLRSIFFAAGEPSRWPGRAARRGMADDEKQRERRSAGAGCRDGGPVGRPAGGTVVDEDDGPAVKNVLGVGKHVEHGGKHAQAQREQHGIGGAVVQAARFVEAGEIGKGHVRAAGVDRLGDQRRRRPGDEAARDGFGTVEDGKNEEADREGTGRRAFGQQRQGEQRPGDAPECPPVLQRAFHRRALLRTCEWYGGLLGRWIKLPPERDENRQRS